MDVTKRKLFDFFTPVGQGLEKAVLDVSNSGKKLWVYRNSETDREFSHQVVILLDQTKDSEKKLIESFWDDNPKGRIIRFGGFAAFAEFILFEGKFYLHENWDDLRDFCEARLLTQVRVKLNHCLKI